MRIRFWGVRGSVPCPGPTTVDYGGNTACIELYLEDVDRMVIIDAGSGIRELSNYIMDKGLPEGPYYSDLFLTHTHWDHIMGYPFFNPIYLPETQLTVYGPATFEDITLKEAVGGQLSYRHFPIRETELSAQIEYRSLKEETLDLGDGLEVTSKFLNHPVSCLGYRFRYQGKVVCTAYDTEPYRSVFTSDPNDPTYDENMAKEAEAVAQEENLRLEKFVSNADLLIYDAQYTGQEYGSEKIGWGHSSIEHAIEVAKRTNAKRLALFHHEPMRTDSQLDQLGSQHCNGDKVFFAKEKMVVEL